jgi:hypothetical protein
MNQTEWYMSKKFRALNNLIVVSPYILRYCSGGILRNNCADNGC